ncbi:hypothetical protein [Pseudotamlana carrageenivorans]|uniref:Uncharacterized protein n=1 Tax=Pseudotamlana carrageenivorans TaxID=2069432 RepID=A0A2I7SJR0_9FLAO|nr:hypothetical protein [Tamlana carrageenivorans]AUS06133.1 hypothetical protein C1A40_12020 [Tamlana carrageenivorans]
MQKIIFVLSLILSVLNGFSQCSSANFVNDFESIRNFIDDHGTDSWVVLSQSNSSKEIRQSTENLKIVSDYLNSTNKSVNELTQEIIKAGGFISWKLAKSVDDVLDASGKFIDDILEADYLAYVTRKTNSGKVPRQRLEWKEVRDYWLNDSPLARGNAFNKKAVDNDWYPYNEVHLGNGKRVDSYKPPANGNPGEIISRKATDLGDIKLSTFESYLNEMVSKYSPGIAINSPKYSPYLDGQTLQGQMFLEIPSNNQSLSNIQDYINLASSKNITLRFKIE